jgi:hypothetical protein
VGANKTLVCNYDQPEIGRQFEARHNLGIILESERNYNMKLANKYNTHINKSEGSEFDTP